jgi:hypothetical protein
MSAQRASAAGPDTPQADTCPMPVSDTGALEPRYEPGSDGGSVAGRGAVATR